MPPKELRFKTDGDRLQTLQTRLGVDTASEAAETALRFLDWATAEMAAGRKIRAIPPSQTDDSQHEPIMFRLI